MKKLNVYTQNSILLLLISLMFSNCNFKEKADQDHQKNKSDRIDSIAKKVSLKNTIDENKPRVFQGKNLWIKQFQCDGFIYINKLLSDSNGNLFWFVNFEGVLKIDSVNTFKNYSDKIFVLQFDSDGNLIFNQKLGGSDQSFFRVLQFKNSFYLVFTNKGSINSIPVPSYPKRKNENENITVYEIALKQKAKKYVDIHLTKGKSLSAIQFDKNKNLILAGAKNIEMESGLGQCEPFTRITDAVPYIEKRKKDSLIWELSCSTDCKGRVNQLFVDEEDNIWAKLRLDKCSRMECFQTEEFHTKFTRQIFITKRSKDGKSLKTKKMDKRTTNFLSIQNFKKDRIIIHSKSSCFTYSSTKYPPVKVYDLDFNKKWEQCFSDSTDARFDFEILPEKNQILAVGHKRTGAIQPGESPKNFLGKQKIAFLRYDTKGNLIWQKLIRQPLRIQDFIKGSKDNYFLMLSGDSYMAKRLNYKLKFENKGFFTKHNDNYFLLKYK